MQENRAADPNDPRWTEYAQALRDLGWTEERVQQALSEKDQPERQEDFVGFLGGEWKVELARPEATMDTDTASEMHLLEEILEEWTDMAADAVARGESITFENAFESFYDNQMDDLHDAAGDEEYQQGNLWRMEVMERWMSALGSIRRYTTAEKAEQAGTASQAPTNSDDTYTYLDPNPNAQ